MNDWFTVEKIDKDTYAISEYGHYEKMHSYLLLGNKLCLLIDTGLGIGNIKDIISDLTYLPIKVVTTHAHWDHIGGHKLFNDIFIHEGDIEWLKGNYPLPIEVIRQNIMKEKFLVPPPEEFDINDYSLYAGEPSVLKDNDVIDIGSRYLKVIHTPGHSPGHVCFYEEERGYLFTGDLIYMGTLYAYYPSTNPVHFKESVDKLNKLEQKVKKFFRLILNLMYL